MSACTRLRDGQVHTSPWFSANMVNPSSALSWKSSLAAITSEKKMLGLLPPSSSVTGMRFWLAYCMISRPVVVSPVKAILAMRLEEASGLPRLQAETVSDIDRARRQDVGDQLGQHQDGGGRLVGRLDHDAIACGEGGSKL